MSIPLLVVVLQHVAHEIMFFHGDALSYSVSSSVGRKVKFVLSGFGQGFLNPALIRDLVERPDESIKGAL